MNVDSFDLNSLLLFFSALAQLPLRNLQLFMLIVQFSFEGLDILDSFLSTVVYLFFWTSH
jgi:hypothetical protein